MGAFVENDKFYQNFFFQIFDVQRIDRYNLNIEIFLEPFEVPEPSANKDFWQCCRP